MEVWLLSQWYLLRILRDTWYRKHFWNYIWIEILKKYVIKLSDDSKPFEIHKLLSSKIVEPPVMYYFLGTTRNSSNDNVVDCDKNIYHIRNVICSDMAALKINATLTPKIWFNFEQCTNAPSYWNRNSLGPLPIFTVPLTKNFLYIIY